MSERTRGGETRDRILAVAERLFAELGYAGAHLEAIAREVGVRKTALYYYFDSKATLYEAVLERMLRDFEGRISAAIDRDLPPDEHLERMLGELNDLLGEHPSYSQILIRVFVDRVDFDGQRIAPLIEAVIGKVLRFYRSGVDAGAFRRLSARHFFQSVLGMAVFHFAAHRFSANVLDVDDVFARGALAWRREQVVELVTRGVLAGDPSGPAAGARPGAESREESE